MIDSVHYLDYIEGIVDYRHIVPAVAFLAAALACAFLGAVGLTGRLRSPAAGWLLWGIAIVALCLFAYGNRTGFALRPPFDYELVQRYVSQNEAPLAEVTRLVACLCLYVGLPLSNLWQSSGQALESASAPAP